MKDFDTKPRIAEFHKRMADRHIEQSVSWQAVEVSMGFVLSRDETCGKFDKTAEQIAEEFRKAFG